MGAVSLMLIRRLHFDGDMLKSMAMKKDLLKTRRSFVRSKLLRPGEDAITAVIVPFLLHDVGMPIPGDIAARGVQRTKDPGTLVANFVTCRIIPGVQQGIGCCLHLLVGGDVDRLI